MRIFNTLTRTKEEFVPLVPGKVGIYVCGPTVYNYIHIGNARPVVVFDTLRRYFEHMGYEVTYVQNYTDIDDKMIKRAQEEDTTVAALAERFIAAYEEDAKGLGAGANALHPKATEHIPEIIAMVKRLEEKGLAYDVEGDVYFDTQAYEGYGKLVAQNLDDMEAGARIDVDEVKRHPADFALWKAQKPNEPAWESPWGMGRPGWHIECSAMSMKYLGETFDIHCGGLDLIFPHHENEIAQSEGATGHPFVRYWMHNGFLNIEGQKMSKSLNNFMTVHDIGKQFDLETVRMFMLSAHYRSPLNFTREQIVQAQSALERLYTAQSNFAFLAQGAADRAVNDAEAALIESAAACTVRFEEAMADDLNTADAIGAVFELVKEANTHLVGGCAKAAVEKVVQAFDMMTGVLGIVRKQQADALDAQVEEMVQARAQARKDKNWAESDRLRDAILAAGYILEDTKQGQKVRKAN